MLRHPIVLAVVADHLSVADLFRLHRALGHDAPWSIDTRALVATRMGLRRNHSMDELRRRMCFGRRCVECGAPTQRLLRACETCTTDDDGPLAMWTRAQIMEHHRRYPVRHVRRRIREELYVVKRGPGRRHYFWKRDVMEFFARAELTP